MRFTTWKQDMQYDIMDKVGTFKNQTLLWAMLLHLPIILKEKEQYVLAPVLSEAVYTIVCEPLSKCVPGAPPWAKLALKIQSVTME